MKWEKGRRSSNVEDRRGGGPARGRAGGRGLKLGGGAALVVVVVALLMGKDPRAILSLLQGQGSPTTVERPSTRERGKTGRATRAKKRPAAEDRLADFVSVVLADTEDAWTELFRKQGERYRKPKLVLFTGSVRSACGIQGAAVGPFYCPADQKVYIDLSFFADLRRRFKAPGDFAQAYVVAHEVGHHVQKLLGYSAAFARMKRGKSKAARNALSVRQELQADCLAGVWAHHAHKARKVLEAGDVEEGLGAAAAIGDDRLQRQARGTVTPESFTHGTSAQRVRWFKTGLKTGAVARCDTSGAAKL